MFMSRKTCQKR